LFIYSFHMPAFVVVSGILSRPTIDQKKLTQLATRLLAPYLIFQLIYIPVFHLTWGTLDMEGSLIDPQKHLWFLLSLFT
jgi:fucose 4-O-acetylase-like acetyltransferase